MANRPSRKPIDPIEAAIQGALEGHAGRRDTAAEPAPAMADRRRFVPPPKAGELFAAAGSDASDPARARAARAASHDRQTVGQILQALQQRLSPTAYVVAAACSGAWLIGCLALSFASLSSLYAALGPAHSSAAVMLGLGALALLPIIFFFGVAHMACRVQELRLIAQAMAGVAVRLAEPEAVAQDAIVSVGQAIRREVAAMGDGVERALSRAHELEAMVQNEVAALARAYGDDEARIRGLMQDLGTQREALVSQAAQVRAAINHVHLDLTQDLSTISELVERQVTDATERITAALAEKGEHVTLSLSQIGDAMIDQLSARGEDLLERLQTARAETARAVAAASDRLNASLSFKTDHIGAEFAELAQGLDDMLTARLDRVSEHFSEQSLAVVDTMVARAQDLTDQVLARSQELTDRVNGRAQEFAGSMLETSSHIAGQITAGTEAAGNTLKAAGESVVLALNLRSGEIAAKLEETGTRITDSLVSRGDKMNDSVRESAEHLVGVVTSHSDAMTELLATRLAALEETLSHSGVELDTSISHHASTLSHLISRHLTEFDRMVTSSGAALVERLDARTQEIAEAMRGQIENFDSTVAARANAVCGTLSQSATEAAATLNRSTSALSDTIGKSAADAAALLEALRSTIGDNAAAASEAIEKATAALEASTARVTAAISRTAATAGDLLTKTAREGADAISRSAGGAEQTLDAINAAIARNVAARAEQIEAALSQRVGEMTRALDDQAAAMARALDDRSAEMTRALEAQSRHLTNTLADKSAGVLNAVSGKGEELASAITRVTDEAVKAIEAKGFGFTRAMVANSEEIARLINKSAQNATAAVTRALGSLRQPAHGVVEAATTGTAATAVLDQHLGAFNTTTVKALSDQFASHGRALAEAVALLESTQRQAQETVASRHAAIEALVATLNARSESFEQRLSHFSTQVDESLASATARAREIAGMLGEPSTESAQVIAPHFDVADTGTDEQRRPSGETPSAVTLGEAQAGFVESAERFAEIMGALKQMAAQMQRELEATRAELRRSVRQLPEETAANAAQVCHVIVEQMKALAALNRIVARHGTALGAVEPGRRAAAPAYAGARPAGARAGAPPGPARDLTLAPRRRGLPSANGRGDGRRGDLLLPASRDDDASNAWVPSRAAASLREKLAVDVTPMIDREAVAALWDRHQRGERGLGGLHLYTARGQKTFEDIRRKYRSDPQFRETVERYIDEFALLLAEAPHARSYLASDTGMVYTMLAHAAGRFER